MNDKCQRYLIEGLAACGFGIVDSGIAFRMRPDIFATALNAGQSFSELLPKLDQFAGTISAMKLVVRFADAPQVSVKVLARTMDQLADRIFWVTGRRVAAVEPVSRLVAVQRRDPVVAANGEEIPSYACAKRTQMLAALGLKDDLASGDTQFPLPRRSF